MDSQTQLFLLNCIYSMPLNGNFAENVYRHLYCNTLIGILLQETLTDEQMEQLDHV